MSGIPEVGVWGLYRSSPALHDAGTIVRGAFVFAYSLLPPADMTKKLIMLRKIGHV